MNKYTATIQECIDDEHVSLSHYNVYTIGVLNFKCEIETNDIELLTEVVTILSDYADRKRVELAERNDNDSFSRGDE